MFTQNMFKSGTWNSDLVVKLSEIEHTVLNEGSNNTMHCTINDDFQIQFDVKVISPENFKDCPHIKDNIIPLYILSYEKCFQCIMDQAKHVEYFYDKKEIFKNLQKI